MSNARRHAPGSPVTLSVVGEDGVLEIVVRYRIPVIDRETAGGHASGMGLAGLTEHAVASGGELSFGTDRHGDFAVRARLPWRS